uniref:Serine/threonine specific protein phosphatases domain-containing protein n=1 Tax=Trichuris muris TaxID=70415 RepID=A0A5S6Q8K7_TRIMR
MLYDLLWADPTEAVPEWIPSERGKTFSFGPMAAELFCAHSKVRLIVRGHQVVDDGYKFNSNGRVLTVFGVPWYKGSNHAALACFDEDGMGTIKQVEVVGNKCAPGKNANVLKLSKKSKAAFRGAVRTKRPFKCLEKQQGKPRKLFSRKDSIRHEDEWMTNSKEGMEKPTIDYDS